MESALSNSGERMTLIDSEGRILLDFDYGDDPPWADSADGDGYSLVLIHPHSNPDHSSYTSWRSSRDIDGNPGTHDLVTYTGNPNDDRDGDGIPSLVEVLLGASEVRENLLSDFFTCNPTPDGETELLLTFSLVVQNVNIPAIEFSNDLESWEDVSSGSLFDEYLPGGRVRYRWVLPAPQPASRYFRIKAIQLAP